MCVFEARERVREVKVKVKVEVGRSVSGAMGGTTSKTGSLSLRVCRLRKIKRTGDGSMRTAQAYTSSEAATAPSASERGERRRKAGRRIRFAEDFKRGASSLGPAPLELLALVSLARASSASCPSSSCSGVLRGKKGSMRERTAFVGNGGVTELEKSKIFVALAV